MNEEVFGTLWLLFIWLLYQSWSPCSVQGLMLGRITVGVLVGTNFLWFTVISFELIVYSWIRLMWIDNIYSRLPEVFLNHYANSGCMWYFVRIWETTSIQYDRWRMRFWSFSDNGILYKSFLILFSEKYTPLVKVISMLCIYLFHVRLM